MLTVIKPEGIRDFAMALTSINTIFSSFVCFPIAIFNCDYFYVFIFLKLSGVCYAESLSREMDSYTNVTNKIPLYLMQLCSNWQIPDMYTSTSTILSNVHAGWGILGAAAHIRKVS